LALCKNKKYYTTGVMSSFKFAGVQMAVTADKEQNLKNARELISEAAKNGAKVVSLPECFNCPYGNQYFGEYSESMPVGPTYQMLQEAATENKIYLIGGSFPERVGDKLYNTSLTFGPDGKLLGQHRKMHLFDIDVPGKIRFVESETLTAGSALTIIETEFCPIGIAICYDMRFPELAQLYQRKGCKFLCYPGAFNMTTGPVHWELLQRARALDNQLYVAAISPARDTTATYIAWGHSTVVDPWGKVIATTEEGQAIIYADIDLDYLGQVRDQVPVLKQKRNDVYEVKEVKQ